MTCKKGAFLKIATEIQQNNQIPDVNIHKKEESNVLQTTNRNKSHLKGKNCLK